MNYHQTFSQWLCLPLQGKNEDIHISFPNFILLDLKISLDLQLLSFLYFHDENIPNGKRQKQRGNWGDKNGQSMVLGSTDLHGVHEDQQRCLKGSTKRPAEEVQLSYKILKLEDKGKSSSKVWWVECSISCWTPTDFWKHSFSCGVNQCVETFSLHLFQGTTHLPT